MTMPTPAFKGHPSHAENYTVGLVDFLSRCFCTLVRPFCTLLDGFSNGEYDAASTELETTSVRFFNLQLVVARNPSRKAMGTTICVGPYRAAVGGFSTNEKTERAPNYHTRGTSNQ